MPFDWWWVADDATDYQRLGAELATLLVEQGLPWLEARETPEGARDALLVTLEDLHERRLPDVLKVVAVTGPPAAREKVEAMIRWRSTPDGRSELYRRWGEQDRARPRPESPLIYTPRA